MDKGVKQSRIKPCKMSKAASVFCGQLIVSSENKYCISLDGTEILWKWRQLSTNVAVSLCQTTCY